MRKTGILFVCYGNACRSIMAEALARRNWGDSISAASAGAHPLGQIPPFTLQTLQEAGIPTEGLYSKDFSAIDFARIDVVVLFTRFPIEKLLPISFMGNVVECHVSDPFGRDMEAFRQALDRIESILHKNLPKWVKGASR